MSYRNYQHYQTLKQLLKDSGFNSYAQFNRKFKVSERQFYRIENGLIFQLTLDTLRKIATGLNLSVTDFIAKFTEDSSPQNSSENDKKLVAEYQKMQLEKEEIATQLSQQLQQKTIATLEPLLLQLPTIKKAVKNSPQMSASNLLPLLKPLDNLLSDWEIEQIGNVGEIVNYNPQHHELMETKRVNNINELSLVKIRYVGYQQKDKLLYRAKVSIVK